MSEVVFHTSGSTGAAKSIVRTAVSLTADAENLVRFFPEVWTAHPPVVASVRPEHMFGALWRVRAPKISGSVVDERIVISVEELAEAKSRYGKFLFVTTPSFLEKALVHPDFAALKGSFHAIVTSGSPLRRETALAVAETTGICPLEIYGSTEAGSIAFRRQSVDGERCNLIDGVAASVGEDGRLIVDSPFAMMRPLAMGDLAEMLDDRSFRLKGRADRRVKILESYVSLSEVETTLATHPFVQSVRVEPYGDQVPRLGALVTLTPAGLAQFAARGSSALAVEFRNHLTERLAKANVPRRFRIVSALPTNEQGKTTAMAVRNALEAWCREPVVVERQATASSLVTELVFPSDMECFKGHFPSMPILPGVAQLYFLRHFARQVFPDWPDATTYRKLKFQKVILPFAKVTMKIDRQGEGAFAFSITGANGPCASGVVENYSSK